MLDDLIALVCSLWTSICPPVTIADPLPEALTVRFHQHGLIVEERRIGPGDPLYDSLAALLRRESEGWVYDSIATYAPGPVTFESERMSINCGEQYLLIGLRRPDGSGFTYGKAIPDVLTALGMTPPPQRENTESQTQKGAR